MEKEKLIQQILGMGFNLKTVEIPEQFKKDLDVAMTIAKINGAYISKLDSSIWNKQIILEALKSNFFAEKYVSKELYNDKDIVLYIVSKNGHFLWKASEQLRDDIDVVMTAIKNDPGAKMFASKRLKESQELEKILNSAKLEKQSEDEKQKSELRKKVEEFKNKPIWWQDEKIVNNQKLENIITIELIDVAEKMLGHKLSNSYLELLKQQNGGRLIKRYYYLPQYHDSIVFEIDNILGIGADGIEGIVKQNDYNRNYINRKNIVIFGIGYGGHTYFLFDYNDLSTDNEPKIIYYDEEIDKATEIASNFKEFIDNLKIHEEVDLIYW